MDREKVIKGQECCQISMSEENPFEKCEECPYNHIGISVQDCRSVLSGNTLELLKEQQQQIWEFQDQVEYLTDKLKEQKTVKPQDAEMLIIHNGGAEEYVKEIESIVLLAHKDYDIVYCGKFSEGR